jgi:AraC-like DNA-binding protein
MRLIEEGFLDAASVAELAERLGIGPRHLLRLFLRHAGAGPSEIAATRRVQKAKRLIDETAMPLSDIAFAAGFGSLRRFNDAFRADLRASALHLSRSGAAPLSATPRPRRQCGSAGNGWPTCDRGRRSVHRQVAPRRRVSSRRRRAAKCCGSLACSSQINGRKAFRGGGRREEQHILRARRPHRADWTAILVVRTPVKNSPSKAGSRAKRARSHVSRSSFTGAKPVADQRTAWQRPAHQGFCVNIFASEAE